MTIPVYTATFIAPPAPGGIDQFRIVSDATRKRWFIYRAGPGLHEVHVFEWTVTGIVTQIATVVPPPDWDNAGIDLHVEGSAIYVGFTGHNITQPPATRPNAPMWYGPIEVGFVQPSGGAVRPLPVPVGQTFHDVPPSHPFWAPIQRLAQAGIVSGHADGNFNPSSPVTKGEVAKMLSNLTDYLGNG